LNGLIAISLVVSLTACSEEASEVKDSTPAAEKTDSANRAAPAPAAPAEAPAAQSQPAPAQAEAPAAPADDEASAMAGAPQATPGKDELACLRAVSTQTNNGEVVTLSVEESEANTLVMVGVGPNKAPWKCLSKDGVVAEVMSMTDEGAL
jgi:hypothetical protein